MENNMEKSATTAMMADIESRLVGLLHRSSEVLMNDPTGEEFERYKPQLVCAQIISRLYHDLKVSNSQIIS